MPPIISFRLPQNEYDQLAEAAKREGCSPNQYAKDRVKEALQGGGQRLVLDELRALRTEFDSLGALMRDTEERDGAAVDSRMLEVLLYLRGMSRPELVKAVHNELVRRGVKHDE